MKVVNPMFVTEIVNNHNVETIHDLDDIKASDSNEFIGVMDKSIPVDVSVFREAHIVKVPPGTEVQLHSHRYPVFRYITDGSMILNKNRV